MHNVIELHTTRLTEITKQLWSRFSGAQYDYDKGTAIIDYVVLEGEDLANAKKEVPWISGNIGFIIFQPNARCPIHTDLHDEENYNRSLNILVESDGDNHSTNYYKYKGVYDKATMSNLYSGPEDMMEEIFSFTVKHPTVFYNQEFHDVNNYGNKRRVMALWLIDKDVLEEEILTWANNNKIESSILF